RARAALACHSAICYPIPPDDDSALQFKLISMPEATTTHPRVSVDGKFFRLGEQKFYGKGVAYGPFAPGEDQECFPVPAQAARDFAQIAELGANVVRIYTAPPRWLLDLAAEHGLKLLIDVAWQKNRCFLDSERAKEEARNAVRAVVRSCVGH